MALTKMDPDFEPTLPQTYPEAMDLLSSAWCNFAVQAFQPDTQDRSLVLQDSSVKTFDNEANLPLKMDRGMKINDGEKFVPPWKTNDIKSWIWMQQAMHPELNYNSYFKKKWMTWKIAPFKNISFKKWVNEIKQRRKENQRLQKAEIHAAISVAGVAAALAAIAAENSEHDSKNTMKESAVAVAAALVASQCAKVAEAMGAKRERLRSIIGSATSGTTASEIVTLTAAAATSIRGAETLQVRSDKNTLTGSSPVMLLEDNNLPDFNFDKCRLTLAKGEELNIETTDGRFVLRSVMVVLSKEAKVILKMKKPNMLNAFTRQKECVVLDLHAELYKDSEDGRTQTGYLIVLKTDKGTFKLDMINDYQSYRTWSMTINHMLMLSDSVRKCKLQFYKN